MSHDCTRAIIDLDAVSSNFDAVRRKAGVPVMAVIKADAYGHGAVPVARLLEAQCAFFGVSSMSEALELRDAGITRPILILGYTPPQAFPDAVRLGIRPAIFCWEDSEALSRVAVKAGISAAFHFAVDTGMSRIGFQVTQADADVCAEIAALPGLTPEGLFSHFATADCRDLSRARAQAERFDAFDAMRTREGEALKTDLLQKAEGILTLVSKVEERSPITVKAYRERLTAKMQEVLEDRQIDEARIIQEAAIYADKVAVDEETVRLRSHVDQLQNMLSEGGVIGRKLDFLMQEMNREANTIGSKGNDVEQARNVVNIKSELEKIREQIQNIE